MNTQQAPHAYELLALSLLLSSPSNLHLAWMKDATPNVLTADVKAALDALPLSASVRVEFEDFLKTNKSAQPAFAVSSGLVKVMYGGAEPHPIDPEASAVVAALQLLDRARQV